MTDPATRAQQQRIRNAATLAAVLAHYGRVCACPGCGATDDLTIDHKNGDGRAQRIKLFGRPMPLAISSGGT